MLIRYLGPAKEITFQRGLRNVTFTVGAPPVEVEDDFGEELLGKAAGYSGGPVFEKVEKVAAPARSRVGEGVDD